jgi:hypothetical protein
LLQRSAHGGRAHGSDTAAKASVRHRFRLGWREPEFDPPVYHVDAFFSFFSEGNLDESDVLETVQQITGRKPRTFEQCAIAHAEAFR